jgi:hypothetical protein
VYAFDCDAEIQQSFMLCGAAGSFLSELPDAGVQSRSSIREFKTVGSLLKRGGIGMK